MQGGNLGCSKCDAQSVNDSFSQCATKSCLSAKYSVKVKWMIILLGAQPALQHFTTFCWMLITAGKITELYISPPFQPLFFHLRSIVSLHCSEFMTTINELFCPGIKSVCHSHRHTKFVLCSRCLKRNKWEIAHHLGVKSLGSCSFSVTRVHSCWYPSS